MAASNPDPELSKVMAASSDKNGNVKGSDGWKRILSYINAQIIPRISLILTQEDLVRTFANAATVDAVEGEKTISELIQNIYHGQARNATKEGILSNAKQNCTSDFGLVEKKINCAWLISPTIHSKRIIIMHFAFNGSSLKHRDQKTFETKSGRTKSELIFNIRTQHGKTEVLIELTGLLPPLLHKVFPLLEEFLASNGIDMVPLKFDWVQATAAVEWNTIGEEARLKHDLDSVIITYESLVAKGSLYEIDIIQFNHYFKSTVLQLYSYLEFGKEYKKSTAEFREVSQFKSTIGDEIYLNSCPCISESCKGSYSFTNRFPCFNRV